jgi:hypothetical protein
MEDCKGIADHDFKFFKRNKKDFNELPVYKCKKCGIIWEEMEEMRDAQAALELTELESQGINITERTKKDLEEGFKRLFGWGNES